MIELVFRQAMIDAGLAPDDDVLADGHMHRFRVEGDKPGSKNGWYVLFGDGLPSGAFGSWKHGISQKWCAKSSRDMTPAEQAEHHRKMEMAREVREAEDAARREKAQKKAISIWQSCSAAPNNHPYLVNKRVHNHGLRLSKGALVVPLRDTAGVLHSLQFIDTDGNKRFLSGGRKKGCYFSIGDVSDTLCIAEGYATAASVHEATGYATACAFDAGNLLPVAQALRRKLPEIKIIICADNDIQTPGNPGLTKARMAAAAVDALVAFPRAFV